jgi:hypothetical protein
MSQLGTPMVDPAVERRANRMMMVILAVVCALLALRAVVGSSVGSGDAAVTEHGFGLVYVQESSKGFVSEEAKEKSADGTEVEVRRWKPAAPGQTPEISWTEWNEVTAGEWATAQRARADAPASAPLVTVSWPRTAGVWYAALMTLAVLSFLWRDNPVYKLAESVVVGVSAGYWMIVATWDTLVPKLAGALVPAWTKAHLMPSLESAGIDWWGLVPLGLGMLLLCRLSARVSWLGIFPLAFVVGTFAGLRFVQNVESDLVAQVATMFEPLVVVKHQALAGADAAVAAPIDWAGSIGASLSAVLILVGVLSVLAYFFFSLEHTGAVGGAARVGIWYLMITFGASFGFTVMGRIALLAARLEFLFDDWLWLIDPSGKH